MSDNKKKKKKKTVYVDDGRTIVDMSGLYGNTGSQNRNQQQNSQSYGGKRTPLGSFRPGHTPKDWFKTYIETVKLMLLPMLATIGAIAVLFIILYLIFELAS